MSLLVERHANGANLLLASLPAADGTYLESIIRTEHPCKGGF